MSTLFVESFSNYGEDASTCVEGVLGRIASDPAYSSITSLDGAPGPPVVSGDDSIASASMSVHYDDESVSGDYVQMIDCRVIVPGESRPVAITDFAPVDRLPCGIGERRKVLANLDLGP